MKILVLGGTQFIGRHVVRHLVEAGHSVTLLNRGKTAPDWFPELPTIKADREATNFHQLPALRQDWDGVIDLSAYFPDSIGKLLPILNGRTGRYVLCSTVSAYIASAVDGPTPIIREDSPLRPCSEAEAQDTSMASYGQRKAECERVAMKEYDVGLPTVILRPCVVFGAHDHTDRLAYWIWRAAQKNPFVLPDDGLTITRRTYAPDLAHAFVSALTAPSASGQAYNIAETDPLSFRDTLFWLGEHLGTKPLERAITVSSDTLLAENVKPWSDLPLWIPRTNLLVDTFKSRRDLGSVGAPSARALSEAADAFLSEGREPKTGLSISVEAELIGRIRNELR